MNNRVICAIALASLAVSSSAAWADPCGGALSAKRIRRVRLELPGLQMSSVQDATGATGATLFYFPSGARVAYDSRGGSVASSETTLLDPGSYSNEVDGIVFAGGSTMGLAAADGVRDVIFRQRAERANEFDFIPSVPAAVVFDYGGRIHESQDPLAYPDAAMGRRLMERLSSEFLIGKAGAGTSTTVNKIGKPRWGGQGVAQMKFPWGTVLAAVVLNPGGDIIRDGKSFARRFPPVADSEGAKPRQNTTLSIVVTDVPLDRNQLRRLAVTVHTSMAESIRPFQTYTDGDIHFAATVADRELPALQDEETEWALSEAASKLMKEAILAATRVSNEDQP